MPEKIARLIMEMYKEARTSVRSGRERSMVFDIEMGIYNVSSLGPLIFVVTLDVLSEKIRAEHQR